MIKLTGHGALLFGRDFGDAAVAVSRGIWNLLRLTRVAAVHDGLFVSGTVEHRANELGELEECDFRESQQTSLDDCYSSAVCAFPWYVRNALLTFCRALLWSVFVLHSRLEHYTWTTNWVLLVVVNQDFHTFTGDMMLKNNRQIYSSVCSTLKGSCLS